MGGTVQRDRMQKFCEKAAIRHSQIVAFCMEYNGLGRQLST
jgi:hypothetical protein